MKKSRFTERRSLACCARAEAGAKSGALPP